MKEFFIYYIAPDREPLRQRNTRGSDRWDALRSFIYDRPDFDGKAQFLFACESPIGTPSTEDLNHNRTN